VASFLLMIAFKFVFLALAVLSLALESDEQGNLSPALTEQFLPARAALLADYWQKTVEKWRFAEMDVSSAYRCYCDGNRYNSLPQHGS
jgi:hypothetical protein